MATVVHDASSSTVSENFPPAVLVIFRKSRGLRDNGTETGTPGTKFPSTDLFLSIIERVRDGTGGGCRLRSIFFDFRNVLKLVRFQDKMKIVDGANIAGGGGANK